MLTESFMALMSLDGLDEGGVLSRIEVIKGDRKTRSKSTQELQNAPE